MGNIKLVLLRHGESVWNKENKFTGWTDVDLSEKGMLEAKEAGKVLKKEGYVFDVAFTSVLKRAIRTLWITLDEMDLMAELGQVPAQVEDIDALAAAIHVAAVTEQTDAHGGDYYS